MNRRASEPIHFDAVADLYDSYVRTDLDLPFWLKETGSVSGKVLELACGTGRVSIPLLEAGVHLSCVDYSPEMLFQFRTKLTTKRISCPVYCQDMAELKIPDRFALIFIPFHSFSEITQRKRQRLALRKIRLHLAELGRFICTLQNPVVRTASMDGTMRMIGEFPMKDGGMLHVGAKMTFDPATHIASGEQVYERYSSEQVRVDRRILGINFYLFDKDEIEALLIECGFSVEALYGDYEYHPFDEKTSPFMIWMLRKGTTDEHR